MANEGLKREFRRFFRHSEKFKQTQGYNDLKEKIFNGKVFPAIREGNMDFYAYGCRALKRRATGFLSNSKFLNIEISANRDISFKDLPFENLNKKLGLVEILGNCDNHSKENSESKILSKLIAHFSFARKRENDSSPILIDVEARFAFLGSNEGKKGPDKIDLVFLMPESMDLLFIEAKRRSDKRIRAKEGLPNVIDQIDRYQQQIQKRAKQIKIAYGQAAKDMEKTFGVTFPIPESIIPSVPVLILEDNHSRKTNSQSKDTWLEPKLSEMEKQTIKSCCWDGVWLIYGRDIFEDDFKKLEQELLKIASVIRQKKKLG